MIEIKDMEKRSFRTFGWVQDPSDFDSLYKVVSIFNKESETYKELIKTRIKNLIEERDGRDHLLEALKAIPLKIKYIDLVGTSFSPRTSARCNGIVQATVEGQQRPYISDWPADNFIRWAQCLGFIKYNYYDDTFEITETGLEFSNSEEGEKREEILENTLLSYPPVVRILNLLEEGTVRTRRAYIIKILTENKNGLTLEEIRDILELQYMTSELFTVVKDDIQGLINIGLNINLVNNKYFFDDEINDFIIPRIKDESNEKSEITIKKDELRESLDKLSHEYLSLIDLSYDSKQNRLFEMKVVELLIKECKYRGLHLGKSRKPDGIIYTSNLKENYGVIIDTKVYSKGYDLPISQVDEMTRYIVENNERDETRNPNKWWNNFSNDIDEFYFTFISGEFKGNIDEKLNRISIATNRKGVAIAIISLLKLANEIKAQRMDLNSVKDIFVNKVY